MPLPALVVGLVEFAAEVLRAFAREQVVVRGRAFVLARARVLRQVVPEARRPLVLQRKAQPCQEFVLSLSQFLPLPQGLAPA